MVDFTKNKRVYWDQVKVMVAVGTVILIVLSVVIALLVEGKPSKKPQTKDVDLVGIINESFTEKNLVAKRTGGVGISPLKYKELLQKVASRDYLENEIIDVGADNELNKTRKSLNKSGLKTQFQTISHDYGKAKDRYN